MSITKDYEDSVLKEIERQNANMSLTLQKQFQLDQEKRLIIMKREQEYQEKQKFI